MREQNAQGAMGPEPRELGNKETASFQVIVLVSDTDVPYRGT